MFYENQSRENQELYKKYLKAMGEFSNMFSENNIPYLHYRAHENLFTLCFKVKNLARKDCSADVVTPDKLGIGLKTWIGQNDQKVAEFGKLRPQFQNLSGLKLIKKIAEYRNLRIQTTINTYGLQPKMIYHVVKRVPGAMKIYECPFDKIDIDNIKIIPSNSDNNIPFTDGKHKYHFSLSKNTLYMHFDDMVELDSIPVVIKEDPYSYLIGMNANFNLESQNLDLSTLSKTNSTTGKLNSVKNSPQLCLRLYSHKKEGNVVPDKSGLNQWHAGGRKRNPLEVYIPYPSEDRIRSEGFFPDRETPFDLHLPNGDLLQAKICQDGGKAIMSSPNKDLGKWLLRDVLNLPEGKVLTYDMLLQYGIDSVIFTKNGLNDYSIDFAPCGTYEEMLENPDFLSQI